MPEGLAMGLLIRLLFAAAGGLAALLVTPQTPNYMLLQTMFAVICIMVVLGVLALIWRRRWLYSFGGGAPAGRPASNQSGRGTSSKMMLT